MVGVAKLVVCKRCLRRFELPAADVTACPCPLCGRPWRDEGVTAGGRGALVHDVDLSPETEPATDTAFVPSIDNPPWRRVALGLDLLFWGWFGLVILPLVAGIILAAAQAGPALLATMWLGIYLLLGGLMLAGIVLCCQAPEESVKRSAQGALGFGLASIILAGLLSAVAAFGGGVIRLHDDAVEMTILGLWLLAGLGGLVALFAWLVFLRRVALYFDSRLLAGHVTAYSVASAAGIGGTAVLFWVFRVVPQLDVIFGLMPSVYSCLVLYPYQLYLLHRLRYLVRASDDHASASGRIGDPVAPVNFKGIATKPNE
jgi:hypothetical protein